MKIRNYDVCVLGDGLGGLISALMLQKQRAKVAVLVSRNMGFDPTSCEFLNGFTLKPVLKRVGFHPTEVNAIPPLNAPLQIVFADHRVDCYGKEDRFERELNREFPQRAPQISQLFRESYGRLGVFQHLFNSRVPLPPKGIMAKRQFNKLLDQLVDGQLLADRPLSQELKSFDVGDDFSRAVNAMELAMSRMITPWTSGARLAHLLTLVRWEGYSAPEGVRSIRDMLLRRLKERGGVVLEYDEIKEIELERNTLGTFLLSGAEWDGVVADTVLVAGDPRGLIAYAKERRPFRKWMNEINKLPIYARKVFQRYRISAKGIPMGMQQQGLILPDAPPSEMVDRRRWVRAVRYVVQHSRGNGSGPEVHLGLTAYLPPEGEGPGKGQISEEIRRNVQRLIPFLEEHLVEEPEDPFIPDPEGKPGDFRQGLIYTSKTPRTLGVMGVEIETPLKNTFLAGDMIFPGLGLDGEIIAGLQATHYVDAYLKKHGRKGPKLAR